MGSVSAKSVEGAGEYQVDPLYGFENGRKTREITVTKAEMESAKIPLKNRDYCTGELLKFLECRADMYPWVYKCHHEKHAYLTCEYEDYVIRMKEFERERRLKERGLSTAEESKEE